NVNKIKTPGQNGAGSKTRLVSRSAGHFRESFPAGRLMQETCVFNIIDYLKENRNYMGVELCARTVQQLLFCLSESQPGPVSPVGKHRVECVCNRYYPCQQRYGIPPEALRVPFAVDPFMMAFNNRHHVPEH